MELLLDLRGCQIGKVAEPLCYLRVLHTHPYFDILDPSIHSICNLLDLGLVQSICRLDSVTEARVLL
ncbi:hypothetical protein AQUCO_06100007v1 [Aquilegia coerulea]|uniref:Uncharacterized protein n=1 Tax=Aquilegia coerulea TaxID=218851 RepID=A0A2G5CD38_AQUCA|nr:hypothetical protein AQUCO_06100007v1 [Aquilegia coerulea]